MDESYEVVENPDGGAEVPSSYAGTESTWMPKSTQKGATKTKVTINEPDEKSISPHKCPGRAQERHCGAKRCWVHASLGPHNVPTQVQRLWLRLRRDDPSKTS